MEGLAVHRKVVLEGVGLRYEGGKGRGVPGGGLRAHRVKSK